MKKAILLMTVLALCLSLCACGQGNDAPENTGNTEPAPQTESMNITTEPLSESGTETNTTTSQTEATEPAETTEPTETTEAIGTTEDNDLGQVSSDIKAVMDSINTFGNATIASFVETSVYSELGEKIRIENLVEFRLEKVYQADTVAPSNPGGSYRHYEADPNEVFIVIEGTVANLSTESLDFGVEFSVSNAIANLLVNDAYIYGGNYVLETADQSNITGELDVGQTSSLRLVFAVPSDTATNADSMYLLIGFGDLVDDQVMSFGNIHLDNCAHRYVLEVSAQ